MPLASANWPRLVRSALAAKNSVLHCFLYAATLSGSRPLKYKNKNGHRKIYVRFFGAVEVFKSELLSSLKVTSLVSLL